MIFETNVLVIGGGLAGYSTALSAAETGAQVLIVEKTAEPGGSTLLSGGSFAFAGTDMQEAYGIEDSPAQLKEDLLSIGKHRNDEALVDVYVAHQLDAYQWMKDIGIEFMSVSLSGGMSVARAHTPQINRAFSVLEKRVQDADGIRVLWQAPATRLLTESEVGRTTLGPRVCGAVIEFEGSEHEVHASSGTVIASGGYTRNSVLRRAFAPSSETASPISAESHQGDGIRLGMSVGAGLADMSEIRPTFGASAGALYGPDKAIFLHAMYRGGIIVDPHGARFVDESLPYKDLGAAQLDGNYPIAYQIFDSRIMSESIRGKMNNDYAGALEQGYLRSADTIEGLAPQIGMKPAALRASVERYNADVPGGTDQDFGRTSLGGGVGALIAVNRPPYYAFPSRVVIAGTPGGLTVSTSMQVRNVFGEPVAHLYAAGEVVGGLHGAGYMSGTMLGPAVTFGRIAGRSAATV
ncbi:FAD-dependent oxidoreductase [Nocardia rhamnosiphila]